MEGNKKKLIFRTDISAIYEKTASIFGSFYDQQNNKSKKTSFHLPFSYNVYLIHFRIKHLFPFKSQFDLKPKIKNLKHQVHFTHGNFDFSYIIVSFPSNTIVTTHNNP